jgi:penicillin-binding protein 2
MLGIDPEHIKTVRQCMWAVINGGGTGGKARLPIPGIELAGKTGTAQVRAITAAERSSGVLKNASLPFKLRDHALFVCFAPWDNPRYAASIVLEHHGHVNPVTDVAPTARDIMTFLFDREKAMASLHELEKGWGGTYTERMAAKSEAFKAAQAAAKAAPPPPVPEDAEAAASNVVSEAANATVPVGDVAGRNEERAE